MNNVRIGVIVICAALGVTASLSLRDTPTIEESAHRTIRPPISPFAGTAESPAHSIRPSEEHPSRAIAIAADADTTGLLAPTMTLDEVLDAFDADVGADGAPIDRDALGAALEADPVLSRMLGSVGPTSVGHSTVRLKPDPQ